MPELSRLTACIDLISMTDGSYHWMAFSYITNDTLLGTEDIDLGLAGDHQQLILYNFGKTFSISYYLIPFHWHTICLMWDGVKGRLELFRNKERIIAITDQPHNLPPNGTVVLGHFSRNGKGWIKTVVPHFTGSLYYFQLWDRILENEEFLTCLYGNVVSWEDDVWLTYKISPTVDRRLHCFVSENMTIQERSTTVSQKIDLTTPPSITELNPQKTVHPSTLSPISVPASTINHAVISYSNTTPSPLATASASKDLKTSPAQTTTFSADDLFTSTAIPLPTQSTHIHTATDSMTVTQHLHLGKTRTTTMVEAMATDTFYPTTATNFFNTSESTKNSIVYETLTTKSQSAVGKITLFLTTDPTSMSPTSCHKHKPTEVAAFPTSKSGQDFLVSSTAGTVSWPTLEETSAITTNIGIASTFPSESLLTSTTAPMNSVFPGNQVAPTLSTTDVEMAFTIHSVLPMKTTSALRTVSVSTNFQDVFSPSMEDAIPTSMPKETSSVDFSSITSSLVTRIQSEQTVIDTESTHIPLTPRTKLFPTLAETSLFPTMEGLVYTQNTPTSDDPMIPLTSMKSYSTYNAYESGLTSVTDKTGYPFFPNETPWTSKPDQTLLPSTNTTTIPTFTPNDNLTSSFQDNTTNIDNSYRTTDITMLEASTGNIGTTSSDATTASSISMQTGKCQWEKPRFKECKLLQALPDKIVDLANITISDENADDIAEHILNLVNESPPLDEEETKIIISKVDDISNCDDISTNLTQSILQIISTVMEKQSDSASNLPPVSNKILRIIERAGHKMEFVGTMANLTVARLALAVLRVDHRFQGMAFSISEEVTIPQVSVASCSAIERGVLAPL
ncbi:adhesion G protein-coupled receptor G4 [Cricetulus griseus]